MNLLLNTYRGNEYADGCEWAFLELTPETASLILRRYASFENLKVNDSALTAVEYYNCEATFLDGLPNDLEAEEIGLGDGNPFAETQLTADAFDNIAARTECDRMVVTLEGVYWTAYPKHCDWVIETRPIDYDTVRKAALINVW